MGRKADDDAVRALIELRAGLDRTIADLRAAGERADELIEQRRAGHTWLDIVSSERAPLVVETVTKVLDDLGELGSRFRREEAFALQRENVSITRIGELFRVTRQRASALLQDRQGNGQSGVRPTSGRNGVSAPGSPAPGRPRTPGRSR